jgi:hypothetical protein|tara:strand:+ start:3818 stop:4285 length:468 start_codon:yes stop_codon:yes gene_type:complete
MVFFSFLIVAWVLLLAIILWDLIQKGQNKLYMFILIPASLLLTVTTYITVQGLLGYPTKNIKSKKFILISSAVKEPDWVYYWVVHDGDIDPIAYKVPYTEPEHKKQEKASESMSEGEIIEGEFIEPEDASDGSNTNKGSLEFYKFDFSKRVPKGK